MPAETVEVVVGFPVAGPITPPDGEVEPFELPAGRVVTGTHVGPPYETLEQTYGELMAWTGAQGLTLAEGMWESYLSDPSTDRYLEDPHRLAAGLRTIRRPWRHRCRSARLRGRGLAATFR